MNEDIEELREAIIHNRSLIDDELDKAAPNYSFMDLLADRNRFLIQAIKEKLNGR